MDDYPAMASAIAMAAVSLVTAITMVFSPGQHVCKTSGINTIKRDDPTGCRVWNTEYRCGEYISPGGIRGTSNTERTRPYRSGHVPPK
jgi:hypothetical protein